MPVTTQLRRWGPALLLAATSFGAWQEAQRRDIDDVSVEPVAYELELATPVLSARRIPRTLQAPVVDDAIRPTIQATVDASPGTTCVLVRVGDRVLEPTANPDTGLVPASNQKLLTAWAALEILGDDFRFRTEVAVDAAPQAGVVEGNLYLIGGGDPFLTSDDWWAQYEEQDGRFHTRIEDLAEQIAAAGVTTITGTVVGDESRYDQVRTGPWAERLIIQNQAGPLSALSYNEGYTSFSTEPPASLGARVAAGDPAAHAADGLVRQLQARGITVGAAGGATAASGVTPETALPLTSIDSPSLVELVTHINSWSSNFGAEMILKRLGLEISGTGSTEAGASVLADLLAERGFLGQSMVVTDGSGLSEANRVTCRAISDILADAGADSSLARSLSIGAERGSLDERFVDTPAAGHVFAKTGTLNSVSALSGYVSSDTDAEVATIFSYIANEEPGLSSDAAKAAQEPLVVGLTGYPGPPTIDVLLPLDPITD